MAQRGRKSAASNVVSIAAIGIRPTLTPCRPLSRSEKRVFDLVAKEHQHLRAIDAPLLTGFVIACAQMFTTKDASDFEKMARVALSFATRLRLSPQSITQPRTLGRHYADAAESSGLPKPWEMPDDDDNEEEDK